MEKIYFQSDNTSGVHPQIMEAINKANQDHAMPYGSDAYSLQVQEKFRELSGRDCDVVFVLGGTGGNVLAMDSMLSSYEALICTDVCHIHTTETGAFEKIVSAKIYPTPNRDGKLDLNEVKKVIDEYIGTFHHNQPAVISIAQTTELGTVYTVDEIREICEFAHQYHLKVHMDGARISNALAYLGCSYQEMVVDTGVDVVTFGGTKNGMLFGEANVYYDKRCYQRAVYMQKQDLQLISKMRFIPAQFLAFFQDDLYLKMADHANRLITKTLKEGLKDIPGVEVSNTLQSNQAFLVLPEDKVEALDEKFYFAINRDLGDKKEIRLVTSFQTTQAEMDAFVTSLKEIMSH